MPRFCMSFCDSTSMLIGTSCRFSSTLRAVTTTSCNAPPAAAEVAGAAVSANAGARGTATPARAAATARPILVRAARGSAGQAAEVFRVVRFRLDEFIPALPLLVLSLHGHGSGSAIAAIILLAYILSQRSFN